MRKSDAPFQGRPAKKCLSNRTEDQWQTLEWLVTGSDGTHIKVVGNTETLGDQFECAYVYLWMTDQPRALAAMIVYTWLLDS